jgi:hypothetical protein
VDNVTYLCLLLLATAANMLSCFWLVKNYIASRKAYEAAGEALDRLAAAQHERIHELEKVNDRLMEIMRIQREET